MSFAITGKIVEIMGEQQVNPTLRKREFVLEYIDKNPQYPQYIKFELKNRNCDLIDAYQRDEVVQVDFDLRGRRWVNAQGNEGFFNTLEAWRLGRPGMGAAPVQPQVAAAAHTAPPAPRVEGQHLDGLHTDLPF